MSDLSSLPGKYDVVFSSLAVHYIAEIINTLVDNGFVIRKVLEPLIIEQHKPNFLLIKAEKSA